MKSLVSNTHRIALAAAAALSSLVMTLPSSASAADHASYVLFAPGNDSTSMSGSVDDIERARALRAGKEPLLYVRQGGVRYIIRDPATLRAAAAIFKPQAEMGARQAELGSRQAALGSKQAALGAQQAHLGALQADARPSEQDELGRQQDALGRQQDELGKQQSALGEQQDALGREQDRLGRIARDKFDALLADALKRGVAQRVD
ncbi:MAG TPA: hypothetical protein VFS69_07520 [Sphingomicrobium sp.]|nr:hypothetical protein [Sphingomicrobium sp.]